MSSTEREGSKSLESTLLTSLLRNVVQQGSIYLIGMVAVALAAVAVLPIYARIFTPAQYGLLSLATLLVSIGATATGHWLNSCITRFLPYYQRIHRTDTLYSTILLSTLLSLAGFFLLGVPAYFLFRVFFAT